MESDQSFLDELANITFDDEDQTDHVTEDEDDEDPLTKVGALVEPDEEDDDG